MGKFFVKSKKVFFVLLLLLSVSILTSANVYATEGGGNAYPLGAEDFMSGAVPPPGYYFINYFLYRHADSLNDAHGNNINPNFDAKAIVENLRFIYVTKTQIFGGYWGVQMFVPFWYIDLDVGVQDDTEAGLGDIIVDPFLLSWHFKNWHLATGIDIYIPTGSYDEDELIKISRNYWTFEPVFAFTYLSEGGFEVSSKFMYDFNTENPDTNYQSGQEFHFDYTLGYKIDNWRVGLGGYYYKQVTNDEQNGVKFGDGNKGQAIALGPQVQYQYKNMFFTLKYQIETEVENKAEGDNFWFKFIYAF